MVPLRFFFFFILFVFIVAYPEANNQNFLKKEIVKSEVFICFRRNIDQKVAKNFLKNFQHIFSSYTFILPHCCLLKLRKGITWPQICLIKNKPFIKWIAPNVKTKVNFCSSPKNIYLKNNPLAKKMWHLAPPTSTRVGIDAYNAWPYSQGDGVVVAILGSGVDIYHEDLHENIFVNKPEIEKEIKRPFKFTSFTQALPFLSKCNKKDDNQGEQSGYIDDFFGWNFLEENNYPFPHKRKFSDNFISHDTSSAGIIASVANNVGGIGIAPKSKILPVVAFSEAMFDVGRIVNALEYASKFAHVIVCNFKVAPHPAITEVIDYITTKRRKGLGVVVCCAAGNDANFRGISYPAMLATQMPGVIAVGASDQNGKLHRYSNFNIGKEEVTLVAPVYNETPIVYHDPMGNKISAKKYGSYGGTSAANDVVAGVVALMLSKNPKLTAGEVKKILQKSAYIPPHAEKTRFFKKKMGAGIVNAHQALKIISKTSPSPKTKLLAIVLTTDLFLKSKESKNFVSILKKQKPYIKTAFFTEKKISKLEEYLKNESLSQTKFLLYVFGSASITKRLYSLVKKNDVVIVDLTCKTKEHMQNTKKLLIKISQKTQCSFFGSIKVKGTFENGFFNFLVKGLEGQANFNQDNKIELWELEKYYQTLQREHMYIPTLWKTNTLSKSFTLSYLSKPTESIWDIRKKVDTHQQKITAIHQQIQDYKQKIEENEKKIQKHRKDILNLYSAFNPHAKKMFLSGVWYVGGPYNKGMTCLIIQKGMLYVFINEHGIPVAKGLCHAIGSQDFELRTLEGKFLGKIKEKGNVIEWHDHSRWVGQKTYTEVWYNEKKELCKIVQKGRSLTFVIGEKESVFAQGYCSTSVVKNRVLVGINGQYLGEIRKQGKEILWWNGNLWKKL